MSVLKRSVPYDHNNPAVRHRVFANEDVQHVLDPFRNKPINAKYLRALGDALAPSQRQIDDANAVAHRIQETIKTCREISVARTCISGSFGRKTALPSFDIDLIVFVNNASDPFTHELSFLREYLGRSIQGIKMVKMSPYSITFYLQNFEVDLLLAPNVVVGNSADVKRDQRLNLRKLIKKCHPEDRFKKARYLSPAFAESQGDYMKKQQSFANAAVRLCKLWKKCCSVRSNTFPRFFTSYLIELIAVNAAKTELEDHPSDASLVRVFKAFLNDISEPCHLRLVCTDYYSESDIPPKIAKERPLVMDPVNPYLNIAKTMDWTIIKMLAQDTMAVLDRSMIIPVDSNVCIGDLFTPRLGEDIPRLFRWLNFQLRFVKSGSWLRTTDIRKIADLEGAPMNPGVRWRAMEKLERNEAARIAKPYVLNIFNTLVDVTSLAMSFHVQRKAAEGVGEVEAACNFLDEMLLEAFNEPVGDWFPTTRVADDCDVTCVFGQVPIPSRPDDLRYLYLSLSFDVDDHQLDYLCNSIASSISRKQQEE